MLICSVSAGELMADHGDPLQLDTYNQIFKIEKHLNTIKYPELTKDIQ